MTRDGGLHKSDQTDGLIDIPANTSNRLNLIGAAYSPDFKNTVVAANRLVGLDLDDRFDPKMLKILQLSYLSGWDFANQLGYPRFVADPPGS